MTYLLTRHEMMHRVFRVLRENVLQWLGALMLLGFRIAAPGVYNKNWDLAESRTLLPVEPAEDDAVFSLKRFLRLIIAVEWSLVHRKKSIFTQTQNRLKGFMT